MRKIYLLLLILLGFFSKGISQSLSGGALTGFGNVCVGTTAGPKSFINSGTGLTAEDITIGPLLGYSFSTTSGGTYVNTLPITQREAIIPALQFIVKFTPGIAPLTINGNITISGGGASSITVAVTGTASSKSNTNCRHYSFQDQYLCWRISYVSLRRQQTEEPPLLSMVLKRESD